MGEGVCLVFVFFVFHSFLYPRNRQNIVFDGHKIVTFTVRDIGAKLRCSKTTMHYAIVKFNAGGTFHDRKWFGRSRNATPKEIRSMRQIVMRSPNTLKELLQDNPCYFTLKRYSNMFQHCFETSQQRIWTRSNTWHQWLRKRDRTLTNVIAIGLSLSEKKVSFLTNVHHSGDCTSRHAH